MGIFGHLRTWKIAKFPFNRLPMAILVTANLILAHKFYSNTGTYHDHNPLSHQGFYTSVMLNFNEICAIIMMREKPWKIILSKHLFRYVNLNISIDHIPLVMKYSLSRKMSHSKPGYPNNISDLDKAMWKCLPIPQCLFTNCMHQ